MSAPRERLPDRRGNVSVSFTFENHQYRATAGFYPDGITLGEIFLDTGKINTPLQQNAETSAILVSLLLQLGVEPAVIRASVSGPVAIALAKFGGES